jgi:hypothetical protein
LRSSSTLLVATCGQFVAIDKEKGQGNYTPDLRFHGRDDWIRTSGLTVPNRARYQTAPRPDIVPYVNSPEGTSPVSPNDRLRTPVDRPSTPSESDERQLPQARSARVCGHFCGHAVARLWPQTLQRAVYLRLIGFWELGSETAFPSSRTERSTKLSHEPLRSITLPDSRRL